MKYLFILQDGMGVSNGNSNVAYNKYYLLTYNWLNENCVKRHGLIMGKPDFGLLIDDKCINSEDFFGE